MSCFIAPLVQAVATSACKKALAKHSGDSVLIAKLPTLEKMLWGGSLVLIVDHLAHGELFTFNLHELLTVGIPMSLVVTAVWLAVAFFNIKRAALMGLACLTLLSCKQNKVAEDVLDYSVAENWMLAPTDCPHEVDVVFYYPTCVMKGTDTTQALNDAEKQLAYSVYTHGPICFADYANIFIPYYRQIPLNIAFTLVDNDEYNLLLKRQGVKRDAFASLDYYFENFNNGRPFILAGHSQGSAVLRVILEEYMQEHPEYYERMIATYALGMSVPGWWFEKYPNIKRATGETDTGVFIAWSTEGPGATMKNFTLAENGYNINPLTWSTDSEYAPASKNLGCMTKCLNDPSADGVIVAGYADAQIDPVRCALICTTDTSYVAPGPLGEKSLHTLDWSLYFNDLKENGRKRCAAYLGHEPR